MAASLIPFRPDVLEDVVDAQAHAYGRPRESVPRWLERAGHENVRVWQVDGAVAGALLRVPMGLWLGGRAVPNVGVSGVAIGPTFRGQGHGRAMIAAFLREARELGDALSTLFASTQTLYRSVGFELAGSLYEARLPTSAFGAVREASGRLVPVGPSDQAMLAALEARVREHGHLERGPYIWARIFHPMFEETRAFAAVFDDRAEGYVVLKPEARPNDLRHDLWVTDFVGTTPRALRKLAGFLGEHRAMTNQVRMWIDPHDPLLALLPERAGTVTQVEHWLARVVDVARAVEARGYGVERGVSLALELHDELLPEQSGPYTIHAEDGRAEARRSATSGDALRLGARGLAALYTGFQSATALARLGLVEGSAEALARADRIFAGRTPVMRDFF